MARIRSQSGGVSRVLHFLAAVRNADAVLNDLLHASEGGSAAISGRQEPNLTQALYQRTPIFGFARRPVIHCHDPNILAALATGKSLLTQLDGEWFVP
jgi:hypothetical protein